MGIDPLIGSLTSADSRHISCQVSFSFGLLIGPEFLGLKGGRKYVGVSTGREQKEYLYFCLISYDKLMPLNILFFPLGRDVL